MPLAKIHVLEGRYDERRLSNVSKAVQEALISILKIHADDFFQIIHELPRNRFLHTPSFIGMTYTDDFILLELAFISGRPQVRVVSAMRFMAGRATLNERRLMHYGFLHLLGLIRMAGQASLHGIGLQESRRLSAGPG